MVLVVWPSEKDLGFSDLYLGLTKNIVKHTGQQAEGCEAAVGLGEGDMMPVKGPNLVLLCMGRRAHTPIPAPGTWDPFSVISRGRSVVGSIALA